MDAASSIFARFGPPVCLHPTQLAPVVARQSSLSVPRFDSSRDRDGNALPPGWKSVLSSTGDIYYKTPRGICTWDGPGVHVEPAGQESEARQQRAAVALKIAGVGKHGGEFFLDLLELE